MPRKAKLEQILDLLVNEDTKKAEELLHQLVVEKARAIYEDLMNDEDEEDADDADDLDEDFGGDMGDDFIGDVSADVDDIDTDEVSDGEIDFELDDIGDENELGGEGELGTEERLEDLEAQLSDLRAEFDRLMADELEEPYHDEEDFEGDYDDEDEGGESDFEVDSEVVSVDDGEGNGFKESARNKGKRLGEATKFSDDVPDPGMDKEGKYVGTGQGSKGAGQVFDKSPYTKAPAKAITSTAKPTKFGGGDEKGGSKESAKKDSAETNIDVKPKDVKTPGMEGEGKYSGTGKGTPGAGSVHKNSPFTKRPK